MLTEKEILKYLKRIGIKTLPESSHKNLKVLHKQHLFNIPFENLDIHLGRKIELNKNFLFEKIITNKRGGFCYELNGLFYLLLKSLKYDVKMIEARVANSEGVYGDHFDHMALIVKNNENEYLSDVGFGDSFIEPLIFKLNFIQNQNNKFYKIIKSSNDSYKYLDSDDGEKFYGKYIFTTKERELKDYNDMCNYHQVSPDSPFTQKRIISLATKEGRISLSDNKFVVTKNKTKEETKIISEDQFNRILNQAFKIIFS